MATLQNVAEPTSPETVAAQQLIQLSTGYILSTALHAAVRIKIADLIGAGGSPVQTLTPARRRRSQDTRSIESCACSRVSACSKERAPRRVRRTRRRPRCCARTCPGGDLPMALWMARSHSPARLRQRDAFGGRLTGQPAAERELWRAGVRVLRPQSRAVEDLQRRDDRLQRGGHSGGARGLRLQRHRHARRRGRRARRRPDGDPEEASRR